MAFIRALLLVLASSACAVVATASLVPSPDPGSAASSSLRDLTTPHPARTIPLGFDYRLANETVAIRVPGIAAVARTIPEPPLGATLAGAAVIGFVYWTRRRRT